MSPALGFEFLVNSEVSNVKIVTIDKKQKRMFMIFNMLEIILSVVLLFSLHLEKNE